MRLPAAKIHRAFKELDSFTDHQCGAYVRRAIGKHVLSMVLIGFLAVLAALGVAGGGLLLVNVVERAFHHSAMTDWVERHGLIVALVCLCVITPPFLGLVTGLLIRDAWLRWAIGKELRRSTCPRCEYQLLGMRVIGGVIRCPECGVETALDMLNLRPEDLIMVADEGATHPPLASPRRRPVG